MEINEQLQPAADEKYEDNQEILCIEIRSGGKSSLLPVELVEAVISSPVVADIPESREEIIGIGMYGRCVVPYYQLSDEACSNKGQRDIRCGVILGGQHGCAGIAADEISEEKKVLTCEYEEQIPEHLRWILGGNKCDKTGRQGI